MIAEHVALPSRGGFFDPRDYLMDVAVRESYEDPDTLLVGGDASGEPASHEVPRGSGLSTSELLKLCKLLDDAGILALVSAEDAEDISQIFAQRKKFDPERAAWILRLLFDRRRRNERERHLHAASRDMPHAACFLDIILDDFEHIEFDTSDLECFYYTFLVSMKRALRNVFGRPLRASLFADFACYRPELAGRMVVPALASLAMGDRNACDYAQASNRELLIRAGALDPTCEVHCCRPIPRSRTLHGVLIDDRLSLSLLQVVLRARGPRHERRRNGTPRWTRTLVHAVALSRPRLSVALVRGVCGVRGSTVDVASSEGRPSGELRWGLYLCDWHVVGTVRHGCWSSC